MTSRLQQLAVVATCLLAATTNAGAVTTFALLVFVLPAVVVAAAVGAVLAARHLFGTAIVLGGLAALGWSELVNIWSGNGDGPAARATFVAAGCTLVAVVVARSQSPALFLVAVAGSVCGALLLGAGGEVRIVAVAAAVAAALTLASIESTRRNWTTPPRRGPSLVLLALLVGAAAAGAVLLQAPRDPAQPEALGAGLAYPGIKPPWTDPLGTTDKSFAQSKSRVVFHVPSSDRLNPRPVAHVQRTRKKPPTTDRLPTIWPYVVAVVLLILLALAARLLAVRLAWRRLRRRLRSGAIAEQITGAWAWTRLRLDAFRLPLAAAVSPDVLAADGAEIPLPADVVAPLKALAQWTTTAAFAHRHLLADTDATAAWTAARQAERSARAQLTRRARVRVAFRGPAPTPGTSR